jgi:hypothetical protein
MARRSANFEEPNMDAMLDTMFNVVGILLLVLILLSINMDKALRKILAEVVPVTPEQLQANVVTRDKRLEDNKTLQSQVGKFTKPEELEAQLKQLDLELENLESDQNLDDVRSQMLNLLEEIKKIEAEISGNETKVKESTAKYNELLALLNSTVPTEGPPPQVVTLPAGQPARDGAEPRIVLCVSGKVYCIGDAYAHAFKIRELLNSQFAQLAYSGEGKGYYTYKLKGRETNDAGAFLPLKVRSRGEEYEVTKVRFDPVKVREFLKANEARVGTPDYRYVVEVSGDRLTLRYAPQPSGGESPEQFLAARSALRNLCSQAASERHYVWFVVAPDSFEAYLHARRIADEARAANGWEPWTPATPPVYTPALKSGVLRQFVDVQLEQHIQADVQVGLAGRLLPPAQKNLDEAKAEVDKVPDAALKEVVRSWSGRFGGNVNDARRHLPQSEAFKGKQTVLVEPQLPAVPHILLYTDVGPPPKEVPKPAAPPRPAGPPQKDVLD